MSESMSNADNFWLCMDDPTNLMVITAFMAFDEPLDFKRLQETIGDRLLSFPRFKKRVVRPVSGVGVPHWERDKHFDIRSHVHRITLPAPGDKQALQEMVSDLMTTPLDPTKPLWQAHLIEKYGKGCAVFFRLHHCIADGIALIHVLLSMADEKPDAARPDRVPKTKQRDSRPFDPFAPILSAMKSLGDAADLTQHVGKKVADEFKQALSEPYRLVELAKSGTALTTDIATVLGGLALMSADPRTPFKGRLGVRKGVVWTEPMLLDKVKSVGRAINTATLNDVLIATVTGAMRRYLSSRDYPVNQLDLRVTVPVNIRKPGTEFELGNKFSLVFLGLPVFIEDPVLRLKEIKRRMDRLKKSADAIVNFGLLCSVGFLPPGIAKRVAHIFSNKASAVMTNVPGPRQPLYFAGKKIKNMMFWVPRSGAIGLGISILSYDGKVTVGIAADEGLMPDPEVFLEGFEEEFNYLLDLVKSGKIDDEPLVLHDRYQETRCQALTRSGDRCKKRAVSGSAYCTVHRNVAGEEIGDREKPDLVSGEGVEPAAVSDAGPVQCKGLTKKGKSCRRRAMPGSDYCSIHQPTQAETDDRVQELASLLKALRE